MQGQQSTPWTRTNNSSTSLTNKWRINVEIENIKRTLKSRVTLKAMQPQRKLPWLSTQKLKLRQKILEKRRRIFLRDVESVVVRGVSRAAHLMQTGGWTRWLDVLPGHVTASRPQSAASLSVVIKCGDSPGYWDIQPGRHTSPVQTSQHNSVINT